ncbi:glycosyltransferase [Actinoplanes sp. LDG1-06]|uniref:Glycosyltransferase n=1 Tax=Paractinoplanes ovalisporus TaxID=2810368 RepID=A0ABS2ALH1_9ACTN|nr:cellulose synthase catalytic subunit [Actinoplanes ovalisporus]MBM2620685.1 glycosyltransferase [Actinoplanes ovalisporus]
MAIYASGLTSVEPRRGGTTPPPSVVRAGTWQGRLSWLTPPTDAERDEYLRRGQHRWLFWAQAAALVGVAVSLYGLAQNSYWTFVFVLPLLAFVIEQVLALRTSTYRRRITLAGHRRKVDTWAPASVPSVDVFLPVCGEEISLIDNTAFHAARLRWPGTVTVYLLDDAGDPAVERLARRYGFRYLARPGSAYKKAGNLQWAFERSTGDHITILDADFVPRDDYLLELVPYMDDPDVGIVQSPQLFFTDRRMTWLERCAGATQEMFYRFIQPSRDATGAAICVGTSAIYRRAALAAIGGFPLIGHSEDVYTGIEMAKVGYRLRYVATLVSRGRCPDDVDAFITQQYRWCEGSMSLLADPEFHQQAWMTPGQRASYWSGFAYYLTTSMNALLAPLASIIMLWFFPDRISNIDALPLAGATLVWLVLFPLVAVGRWRIDVLRVQTVYSFAHLFCLLDMARGRRLDWVPTGRSGPRKGGSGRVRVFMSAYLSVTQLLVLAGLAVEVLRAGPADRWALVLLTAVNAYVFVPVAVLGWRATLARRSGAPSHRSVFA